MSLVSWDLSSKQHSAGYNKENFIEREQTVLLKSVNVAYRRCCYALRHRHSTWGKAGALIREPLHRMPPVTPRIESLGSKNCSILMLDRLAHVMVDGGDEKDCITLGNDHSDVIVRMAAGKVQGDVLRGFKAGTNEARGSVA